MADLLQIVVEKVKPYRDGLKRDVYRNKWWQFGKKQTALYSAIHGLKRVLAISRVGQQGAFTFLDKQQIFADSLVVFCLDSFNGFCTLQSRIHEIWARFMASSMKDDMRYTPSDCFETFPFPRDYESIDTLELAGKAYYEFRAELMICSDQGLTKTYNRFHDRNEDSPLIKSLRDLHAAMDRVVLDAYGWQDLQPVCEFFPEFDEEEEEDEGGRPKKKKYRYRWPDDIHDEVLARLLDLNRQRALEEGQILVPVQATDSPWVDENVRPAKKNSRKNGVVGSTGHLFVTTEEEA